jgi:hypothetical protein
VHSFETDIGRWSRSFLSPVSVNDPDDAAGAAPPPPSIAPVGERVRRSVRRRPRADQPRTIVLVEPGRKEATDSFLARIEGLGGERKDAGVFDWRILEDIAEQESRTMTASGGKRMGPRVDIKNYRDLWSRRHIGRV